MELPFDSLPLSGKALIVGCALVGLLLAERIWRAPLPEIRLGRPAAMRRLFTNGGLWLLNALLSPLVVLPLTALAAAYSPWSGPVWRPDGLGLAGLLADVVLLDCFIYWWHRFSHVLPLLWRFHEIHHLDRDMDVTTSVRFHFGEVCLSAAARAVVVLSLGIPLASVVAFEVGLLLAAAFHHSRLRLPAGLERALSRLIVTPSIHWIHHHERPADLDSNYATILSLWDPLFGSRSPNRREDMGALGVAGREDRSLIGLIVRPFRVHR